MDISSLIPQLFYDVIGRIIPGAALLASALILFEGPEKALRHIATWSNPPDANIPIALVIIGNILAAHILATLLGGIWFRVFRLRYSGKLLGLGKYLNAWGKRGEDKIEQRFNQILDGAYSETDNIRKMKSTTDRIAYAYDYVLLHCPKAGARIAKLRAEQHMSGVLMIGFVILILFCYWFPYIKQAGLLFWLGIEFLLIAAVISAGSLAWHLEKRCNTALFNLWLLASSGGEEK
jgi:hypothetical protein